MTLFSLILFDEKKKNGQTEEDKSIDTTKASESDAPKETGEEEQAFAAGKQKEQEVSFEELIAGKYKEAFAKKVQEIINRRFKETKQMEEKLEQWKPLMAYLTEVYGGNADTPDAMLSRIKETGQDGETVEALKKKLTQLELMNERSKRAMRARDAYESWAKDADAMQTDYPDFTLAAALNNPQVAALLRTGMGLRGAYEATHLEAVKEQLAKKAREEVEAQYREKHERPEENGIAGGAALRFLNDVSRLSREERKEIARRAARGEKIKL